MNVGLGSACSTVGVSEALGQIYLRWLTPPPNLHDAQHDSNGNDGDESHDPPHDYLPVMRLTLRRCGGGDSADRCSSD